MIPQTDAVRQAADPITCRPADWQQSLSAMIRSVDELLNLLGLQAANAPYPLAAGSAFPLRVTREFAARMRRGDWWDPLLLQVLTQAREDDPQPGYDRDPLQEAAANPAPGLIHKYRGRALLIVSGGCAIHCRYCFRRHFPYQDNNPGRRNWDTVIDYLRGDPSIREVILSGGDPLVASDSVLAELVSELATVDHLDTLRIHSRLPIVLPQRIDDDCLRWMTATRLQPVMVVHSNHPREIDAGVTDALLRLRDAGITTLNQTVLLAGINDAVEPLAELSRRLFAGGCLPYYLHVLDRVDGAAHFACSDTGANALMRGLRASLPGYLVPRLVREVAGADAKVPVTSD